MDSIVLGSDEEKQIGHSPGAIAEGKGPWSDSQRQERFGQEVRLRATWVEQGDAIFQWRRLGGTYRE
jgi:hypothetical protein